MNSMWIRYGFNMGSIWIQYGFNMDSLWIQHGLNMDSIWILYGLNKQQIRQTPPYTSSEEPGKNAFFEAFNFGNFCYPEHFPPALDSQRGRHTRCIEVEGIPRPREKHVHLGRCLLLTMDMIPFC